MLNTWHVAIIIANKEETDKPCPRRDTLRRAHHQLRSIFAKNA